MSISKTTRLLKDAFRMYSIHFSKNFYLSISIAVSLLIFLAFALSVDFQFANYAKSYRRIQNNYIVVQVTDSKQRLDLEDSLHSFSYITQSHSLGLAVIQNEALSVSVDLNLISSDRFYSDIYIRSGMDGGEDIANAFGYEKYVLLYGRETFHSPNEVILSTDFATLLAGDPKSALGMPISFGINGPEEIFTVIGVYDAVLSERRVNQDAFNRIRQEKAPGKPLVFTVFLSNSRYHSLLDIPTDFYVFFKNEEECLKITETIDKLNSGSRNGKALYTYITPRQNESNVQSEYRSATSTKAFIMIIVSLISGISVFGTMKNSISDRKREIGIKKALGASDRDIVFCFMIENMLTAVLAMFITIGIASLISSVVCYYERHVQLVDFALCIYPSTVYLFLCFALSSVIGFSIIPAYHTTQINIVDTIRDE